GIVLAARLTRRIVELQIVACRAGQLGAEDADGVVLAHFAVAVSEDRGLTLEMVAADRRTRTVDLDALELADEVFRNRRNRARIDAEPVEIDPPRNTVRPAGAVVERIDRTAVRDQPVRRLLARQANVEVRLEPERRIQDRILRKLGNRQLRIDVEAASEDQV